MRLRIKRPSLHPRRLLTGAALALFCFSSIAEEAGVDTTQVLSQDWETYKGENGYWAINNTWGASPFVNGRDYKQTITIDRRQFPNNTVIEWSWPNKQSNSVIYGYPEISWGPKGTWSVFSDAIPAPTKIKDLKQLSAEFSFELSGNLKAVDVLMESFLTNVAAPTGKANDVFEICFLLYSGPSIRGYEASLSPQYRFTGKFNAQIAVAKGNPPIVLIVPDKDIYVGTIDMLEVYRFLMAKKIISGEEYIRAVELGAEAQGNVPPPHRGKLVIQTLSYQWR